MKGRAASVVRYDSSTCCSSWWALSRSRTSTGSVSVFLLLQTPDVHSLKGMHLGDLSSMIRDWRGTSGVPAILCRQQALERGGEARLGDELWRCGFC